MVLGSSQFLITNGAVIGVLASSQLLLVTNGAVIGGSLELTYVVSNWSSNWWCSRVHICC